MITSDVMRGYHDTIVLYLLLEQPSYGYAVSKKIRQLSQDKYIVKETTLYSTFSRLEKHGCIASFSGSESFGKARTYYRITQAGRDYYKQKCQEWRLIQEVMNRFIMDETNPE